MIIHVNFFIRKNFEDKKGGPLPQCHLVKASAVTLLTEQGI